MPTSPAKARKLLRTKKAEVYCRIPFTIKLLYKTGGATQALNLGVDAGDQHIGIAVAKDNTVVYKAEIELRKSMETRKEYRRLRRYRKVRYRKPKFFFRTKRAGTGRKFLTL